MTMSPLLTPESLAERMRLAAQASLPSAMLLNMLLKAGHGEFAVVAIECVIARLAVERGIRLEVSPAGWRVDGGPPHATLNGALGVEMPPPPPAAVAESASEDDDAPQPF